MWLDGQVEGICVNQLRYSSCISVAMQEYYKLRYSSSISVGMQEYYQCSLFRWIVK